MLLTITTTMHPATDLGYLLEKNPANCQAFSLAFGKAHVFYPVATEDCCTMALLLEMDPVALVRGFRGRGGDRGTLAQYVNDRPYVASSFMSVAIARVLASAIKGASRQRPEMAEMAIPLCAELSVLPCRGGEMLLRKLFEPLGYEVEAQRLPLDDKFSEWGESAYFQVRISATCRLRDLLGHLYVLLPVLDNDKHYWVGKDELTKLLEKGHGWLTDHPEREQIINRYLKHQRGLVREALARLMAEEDLNPGATEDRVEREEQAIEGKISLNQQRMESVVAELRDSGARRVLDLGCGEGRLMGMLLKEKQFDRIVGMDVSIRALDLASDRLRLDRMPPQRRERIELIHGALTYRDARLAGFDAACAIEVIEHLDEERLPAFDRVVFEFAKPKTVIITTPNVEYNSKFETLEAGTFRHRDHRFEWSRATFQAWADRICSQFNYTVRFRGIGDEDKEVGSPTQMGVFTQCL